MEFESGPNGSAVKNLPAMQETQEMWVRSLGQEDPRRIWRGAWQPTPVFLPGESHGQRNLEGIRSTGSKRVRHNWIDWAHIGSMSLSCSRSPVFRKILKETIAWSSGIRTIPSLDMGDGISSTGMEDLAESGNSSFPAALTMPVCLLHF